MGSWAEAAKFEVREASTMVGGSQSGP
jgi:hypothetical protein